jgi:PEGA domain
MSLARIVAMLAISTSLVGAEQKVYERGVLLDWREDSRTSLYQGTSSTTYFVDYWVRLGDVTYKAWCRDRLFRGCNINFTIGGTVEVRFEGHNMFLLRRDGKEQKTTVEKRMRGDSQATHATAPPATGSITVKSVPDDADITVDDAYVGNSPATLKLAPGKHRIAVNSPGYKEWMKDVTILFDAELVLNASLQKEAIGDASSTDGSQESMPRSTESPSIEGPDIPASLPKEWIFSDTGHPVSLRIEGDYLYEHTESDSNSGRKEQNCEAKKDGNRWVGKCHTTFRLVRGGVTLACSAELDEIINSVTPRRIEGESQMLSWPKNRNQCPTPGTARIKFVYTPKY